MRYWFFGRAVARLDFADPPDGCGRGWTLR
jgi:hypothetical protein